MSIKKIKNGLLVTKYYKTKYYLFIYILYIFVLAWQRDKFSSIEQCKELFLFRFPRLLSRSSPVLCVVSRYLVFSSPYPLNKPLCRGLFSWCCNNCFTLKTFTTRKQNVLIFQTDPIFPLRHGELKCSFISLDNFIKNHKFN